MVATETNKAVIVILIATPTQNIRSGGITRRHLPVIALVAW
jgi:hypothetical protein